MTEHQTANEQLLRAWQQMSACIRGNRLLSQLSLNESTVCGLLYRAEQAGTTRTAAELCREMRLYKSQMNRILAALERRGMLERFPDHRDRRVVCLRLSEAARTLYLQEHEAILRLVDGIRQTLGDENTRQLTELLERATAAADEYQRSSLCE